MSIRQDAVALRETPTVPGEPLIVFKDVHLGFEEGEEVLRGVSFEVAAGETKVLLGESGSGKTLLMKLGAGLLQPDSGTVVVMGHNLGEMTEKELLDFRRHLGFVFQEGALFDSMTVAQNVSFRLSEEDVNETEIRERVLEALRFVELEGTVDRSPGELSGGMRRRVSIARALIDRPSIIFYDSPTAGLDPVTSQTIITLILRGRDSQGVTSLLATHRLQDAFGLANFRVDKANGRVERVREVSDGAKPASALSARADSEIPLSREETGDRARDTGVPPTNVVVLREGQVYFEGSTADLLHSQDDYLKRFLVSAGE